MFARPHGGHRHRCVRKRSRHVNIGSMWRRMEGECSASPAPSSQDLNNSGNPNTHFMQIASTRLQGEDSPLFSLLQQKRAESRNPTLTLYPAISYTAPAPCVSRGLNSHGPSTAEKLDIGRCCSHGTCNSRWKKGSTLNPYYAVYWQHAMRGGLIGSSNMTRTPLWCCRTYAVYTMFTADIQ